MKKFFWKVLNKFKNYSSKPSFQKKIICIGIIPAVASLFIQSTVLFKVSSDIITKEAMATNEILMKNLSEKVYQFIHDYEMDMLSIYYYTSEMQYIKNLYDGKNVKENLSARLAQKMYVKEFDYKYNISGIYIYSNNNKLISSYTLANNTYLDNNNIRQSLNKEKTNDYILNNDLNMFINSYYNDKIDKHIIRFGTKIRQINRQNILGTIIVDLDTSVLDKIISKYNIYNKQMFFIVDSNDNIIYCSDSNYRKETTGKKFSNIKNGSTIYDKEYEYFLTEPISKYDMRLINTFTINSIETNLKNNMKILIISILLLSLSVLVIAFFLSKNLMRPINNLINIMKKVKNGDMKARVNNINNDEIGVISETFNDMIIKVNELIVKQYKDNYIKKQMQLKALQAQINPHFLYNTLQVMSSIAKSREAYNVSNMCHSLSDMFRYSINMENNLTTLRQEIAHLNNYLYIQQMRFLNKLKVKLYCNIELYKYLLPRLIIQPMVENCIEHGFTNKSGKNIIKVNIYTSLNQLYIYIIDNGKGIDENKLKEIREQLEQENFKVLNNKGSSVGLVNVNERIRILYGDEFRLKIYSKYEKGTIVKLVVPVGKYS